MGAAFVIRGPDRGQWEGSPSPAPVLIEGNADKRRSKLSSEENFINIPYLIFTKERRRGVRGVESGGWGGGGGRRDRVLELRK